MTSDAAGFPRSQSCTRYQLAFLNLSPVLDISWTWLWKTSTETRAHHYPNRKVSTVKGLHYLSLLWCDVARLHVTGWWPKVSGKVLGQSAHWEPCNVSKPSHHLIATWNSFWSRCKLNPLDGVTESHDTACEGNVEKRRTSSSGEELSRSNVSW